MIGSFSASELAALERLLSAEELACKKARAYEHSLTDAELAAGMRMLADGHASRFAAILAALGAEA